MKHKYSKLIIFLYYLTAFLTGFMITIVFAVSVGDLSIIVRYSVPVCIIVCISITIDSKIRINRYVEFFDNYIHFHSLSIAHKRHKYTFNVRYEDIYAISVKKNSLFGVFFVYIRVNNFGYAIPLNCFYAQYKKMYATLYKNVIKANPSVRIDRHFIDFLEKKGLI